MEQWIEIVMIMNKVNYDILTIYISWNGLMTKICVRGTNWNFDDHKQSYDILHTLWNGLMKKICVGSGDDWAKNWNLDDLEQNIMK